MKIFNAILTVVAVFAILLPCCTSDFSAVEKGFVTPPDSIRTGVYWYWINDNISKGAVIKDLQSMKQAGINRAFIGNIGDGYPRGNIKIFSDEWWEVMHTALKTATELDIEIGIFNSPGWSQSGGPWIKPEQSMRYLAASELRVK
ncbi:MAG: glycoside hydrolase family 2, partial [Prevotellaceae bacterium]|nr:glycoside hydrolase family 2 [Prevotellaceae bacterium]